MCGHSVVPYTSSCFFFFFTSSQRDSVFLHSVGHIVPPFRGDGGGGGGEGARQKLVVVVVVESTGGRFVVVVVVAIGFEFSATSGCGWHHHHWSLMMKPTVPHTRAATRRLGR